MDELLAEEPTPYQTARSRIADGMSEDAPDVEGLLEQLVSRPDWRRQATCRGAGPGLFWRLIDRLLRYDEWRERW